MSELVGQVIKDRYHFAAYIGRGGMADVYKVWDAERVVHLAAKVLHRDLALDKIFLRRFKREADTLATLQHPHIVRSYGLIRDGRLAFLLMDYVEGETLKEVIFDAEEALPTSEVRNYIRPVAGALHFAHNQGLVHCDIKPANIMLDKHGEVRLADFGIARMSDAATATMVGAGTPAYMAPEQVRGHDPSPQTDIYALGIVLFEMLTGGERPFTGEAATTTGSTSEKVRWEQINMQPPSPRRWNSDISPELEAVILKCLAKDPKERYGNSLDLLNALELVPSTLDEEPHVQPEPAIVVEEPPASDPAPEPEHQAVQIPQVELKTPDEKPEIEEPQLVAAKADQKTDNKRNVAKPADRPRFQRIWLWGGITAIIVIAGLFLGLNQLRGVIKPASSEAEPASQLSILLSETPLPEKTVPTEPEVTPEPTATMTPVAPTPVVLLEPSAPISAENLDQLTLLGEWGDSVTQVVFSPDGLSLAILSGKHKVEILDALTLEDKYSLVVAGSIVEIALSPDAKLIAMGLDTGEVQVWNLANADLIRRFEGHTDAITVMAFTPDGKILATGAVDSFVNLWNVETGDLNKSLEGNGGEITALAISLDGERLAFADYLDGGWVRGRGSQDDEVNIRIWQIRDEDYLSSLKPGKTSWQIAAVDYLEFSNDGAMLISDFRVWDILMEQSIKASNSEYVKYAYMPNNELIQIIVPWTGGLQVNNDITGDEIFQIPEEIRFNDGNWLISPNREKMAIIVDGLLQIWRLEDGTIQVSKQFDQITTFAYSPDGSQIALAIADQIQIRNVRDGEILHYLEGQGENIHSLSFSPDGKTLVTGSRKGKITLWSIEEKKELWTFDVEEKQGLSKVEFSLEGSFISAEYENELVIWSVPDENPVQNQFYQKKQYAFISDDQLLSLQVLNAAASGWADNDISTFSLLKIGGTKFTNFLEIDSTICHFALNSERTNILYFSTGGAIRVIRISDGSVIQKFSAPQNLGIECDEFSSQFTTLEWIDSVIIFGKRTGGWWTPYYSLLFFQSETGKYLSSLEFEGQANSVISPSNTLLTVHQGGRLLFYGIP